MSKNTTSYLEQNSIPHIAIRNHIDATKPVYT
jgi:hypothetical protein